MSRSQQRSSGAQDATERPGRECQEPHPKENFRLAGRTGLLLSVSGATCSGGGGSGRELKEAASSGGKDGKDSGPGCGSLRFPSSGMSLQSAASTSFMLGHFM